jgi:hypothetical protein
MLTTPTPWSDTSCERCPEGLNSPHSISCPITVTFFECRFDVLTNLEPPPPIPYRCEMRWWGLQPPTQARSWSPQPPQRMCYSHTYCSKTHRFP